MKSDQSPFLEGGIYRELINDSSPESVVLIAEASRLANHSLYQMIRTRQDVRRFMELHAWCVWDFMSLAKSVQLSVGAYSVPWLPPANASLVSAINEIIGGEEADVGPNGSHQSHFEIYLDAMREASADTRSIESAINLISSGVSVNEALTTSDAPSAAIRFVQTTLQFCSGPAHVRVAALCLGREELVPSMFATFLRFLPRNDSHLTTFYWYLRRHIELDSTLHGPLSARLFRGTVAGDSRKRTEALDAALKAVRSRSTFLDEIAAMLPA